MMSRHLTVLAILSVIAISCRSDTLSPVPRSIRVSPKTVALSGGQSVDIQVIVTGFSNGAVFSCRVVPVSAGTVIGDTSKCRLTVSAQAVPGTMMIAQIENLADTATVVVPAR
jgi:hypothetical protein